MKTGQDIEAAQRVLRLMRGGTRSLRPETDSGPWAVFPHGDKRRRPLMRVPHRVFTMLRARGDIIKQSDSREEWEIAAKETGEIDHRPGTPGPPVKVLMSASSQRSSGFAHLAQLALKHEGPLDIRMLKAANDFIGLWEQSQQGRRITQSWEMTVASFEPGAGLADRSYRTEQARERLKQIRSGLEANKFWTIEHALVHGASLRRLEQQLGLAKGEGGRAVADCLLKLSDVLEAGSAIT